MSTNELTLTLVGWLGAEPKHYPGAGGATPFTSFRMASTRRVFDRERGVWADGRTEWFTVKCWRAAARNVAESLRKGDPVVVHGRLSTDEWVAPEGNRTTLVLDAIAIGPDLSHGTARFARTVHPDGAAGGESGEGADGEPGDGGLRSDVPGSDVLGDDLLGEVDERGRRAALALLAEPDPLSADAGTLASVG